MNFSKKLVLCILTVILTLSFGAIVFAETDYEDHWSKEALVRWIQNGVIAGYSEGVVKPDNNITRAEVMTIVTKVFNLIELADTEISDVAKEKWYHDIVLKVKKAGYITGYPDGSMKPDNNITRQEVAVILTKAFELVAKDKEAYKSFADADEVADWSKDFVSTLKENGYISGRPGNIFDPQANITRAEVITMVNNIVKEFVNSAGDVSKTIEGNVVVNTKDVNLKNTTIKGNLYLTQGIEDGEVSLDGTTVEGNVIVRGGGQNSIKVINTIVKMRMILNKPNVRIAASGNTSIKDVDMREGAKLQQTDGGTNKAFGTVNVNNLNSTQAPVVLDCNVITVTISVKCEIRVQGGSVGALNLGNASGGSNLSVSSGAIESMKVDSASELNCSGGSIGQFAVSDTATDAQINVTGSTVTTLDIAAKIEVNLNSGYVGTVEVAKTAENMTLNGNGAEVSNLNLSITATIAVSAGTFQNVNIKETAPNTVFDLTGGNVKALDVSAKSNVNLTKGIVETVKVTKTAENANIKVGAVTIAKATIEIKVVMTVAATSDMRIVDVSSAATGSNINIAQGAKVADMTISSNITVQGADNITTARINTNEVTIDKAPQVVDVQVGVSVVIEGRTINDTNDTNVPPPVQVTLVAEIKVPVNVIPIPTETPTENNPTNTTPPPTTVPPSAGPSVGPGPSDTPTPSVTPSPSPSPSPSGQSNPDASISQMSMTVSGVAVYGNISGSTATIDLTSKGNSELVTLISLSAPTNAILTLTSIDGQNIDAVTVSKQLSSLSSIGIDALLGTNNDEVSLSTLRDLFGTNITITGLLSCSGYNTKEVTLTISLGSTTGEVPNSYFDVSTTGTTIYAKVKTGMENVTLNSIGIRTLITNICGEVPATVSLTSGYSTSYDAVTQGGEFKTALGATTLGQLVSPTPKFVYFKKSGSATIYTVSFVSTLP